MTLLVYISLSYVIIYLQSHTPFFIATEAPTKNSCYFFIIRFIVPALTTVQETTFSANTLETIIAYWTMWFYKGRTVHCCGKF